MKKIIYRSVLCMAITTFHLFKQNLIDCFSSLKNKGAHCLGSLVCRDIERAGTALCQLPQDQHYLTLDLDDLRVLDHDRFHIGVGRLEAHLISLAVNVL